MADRLGIINKVKTQINTDMRTQMGADVKAQISTDMVTQINSGICANLRGKNLRKSAFKKAQASIEVTLAFICFMILLFGSVKIFIWLNERMVLRQEDFEASRVEAGNIGVGDPGVYINESNYPKLDIFG